MRERQKREKQRTRKFNKNICIVYLYIKIITDIRIYLVFLSLIK